jgi:hypothetical protein
MGGGGLTQLVGVYKAPPRIAHKNLKLPYIDWRLA